MSDETAVRSLVSCILNSLVSNLSGCGAKCWTDGRDILEAAEALGCPILIRHGSRSRCHLRHECDCASTNGVEHPLRGLGRNRTPNSDETWPRCRTKPDFRDSGHQRHHCCDGRCHHLRRSHSPRAMRVLGWMRIHRLASHCQLKDRSGGVSDR